MNIESLDTVDEYARVTLKATVVQVGDIKTVSTGKQKQEVTLADATGSIILTLWEENIDMLEQGVSYQLNRVQVRTNRFLSGKLTYPQFGGVFHCNTRSS